MDKILKEIQAQRNYDIEQINRSYNGNVNQLDNWLKSQETSLKGEKFKSNDESQTSQSYSRFKFLNPLITEQDTSLSTKEKKNVSFSNFEEIKTFNIEDEEDDNIFTKLKKVNINQKEEKNENITLKLLEPSIFENQSNKTILEFDNENRVAKLEREVKNLNSKIDKILELLNKN